jgi:hypothetical protein
VLHVRGGPSQLDTWDMKPDAPSEIRGEFNPIATSVGWDCEYANLLPKSAAIMHKWSSVRRPQTSFAIWGCESFPRRCRVVFTGYGPGQNDSLNI